jgi:hypothetical protein
VTPPQSGYSYGYQYGGSDMSAEQRTYNRKIELLGAGLYPYLGDLPPTDMRVTLLAWGPATPDPIAVERYTTSPEEVSLWVSQTTVRAGDQAGSPIQSGTVPYTVYAPGNATPWLAWGSRPGGNWQLAPGQAFPQPMPTTGTIVGTPGSILLEPYAEVRYSLPPGTVARTLRLDYRFESDFALPIDVFAYNTRTGDWDNVGSIADEAQRKAVQLPITDATSYVGPSGDLTVRLGRAEYRLELRDPVLNVAINPDDQQ